MLNKFHLRYMAVVLESCD